MSLLAITAQSGELLGIATSGVDAHLRSKEFPNSRVWKCSPNSNCVELVSINEQKPEPEPEPEPQTAPSSSIV